jgi:hypothetical protein
MRVFEGLLQGVQSWLTQKEASEPAERNVWLDRDTRKGVSKYVENEGECA